MSRKLPRGTLDRLWVDPANWLPVGVYYCKDDPRLIVPKKVRSMGWTMNFAHASVWIALVILFVSATVPTLFFERLHDHVGTALFLTMWVILLVVICRQMSSTSKHED